MEYRQHDWDWEDCENLNSRWWQKKTNKKAASSDPESLRYIYILGQRIQIRIEHAEDVL